MSFPRLTPKARKWLVFAHVVSSVGWLGLNIGNIALVVTGLGTDDPATQHLAFLALDLLGGTLLVPISLLAFLTGLWLSFGTQWGLLRHRWVAIKFALTLFAVVMIPFSLLPGLIDLAAVVTATPAGQLAVVDSSGLIGAMTVSTSFYLISTALSVFKPWGRTRYGARVRQASKSTVTSGVVGRP